MSGEKLWWLTGWQRSSTPSYTTAPAIRNVNVALQKVRLSRVLQPARVPGVKKSAAANTAILYLLATQAQSCSDANKRR